MIDFDLMFKKKGKAACNDYLMEFSMSELFPQVGLNSFRKKFLKMAKSFGKLLGELTL
jgi:hypothetical protein